MSNLRGMGTKVFLLAACLGCTGTAHAVCNGPQALVTELRAHPTTERALQLGSWYADHQQFDCAAEVFRSALRRDPKSAPLHYLNGLALIKLHQSAAALAELEQATQLAPAELKPHLLLAMLYAADGNHAGADRQWSRALAIDPKSEEALEALSNDLMAQKKYGDVIQLLQNTPRNNEKLTITLSRAFGLLNFLDPAGDVLLEAMKAHPDSLPLANAMAVVLIQQQKYQEAINLFEYQVKKHPGNLDAEQELLKILVLTDHINQARTLGPKLLAERPHNAEVLYLNGIVQRSIGNYPQARVYLERAVAIDPNFFNSRYNLGMVLVFLKDYKDAKENLDKAIELGAPQPEVHFELANALRGLGDMQGAMAQLKLYQQQKKSDDDATQAAVSAGQGDRDLTAGKLDEAIRQYRDAVQAQPQSANYHYKLAVALHRKGDIASERAELETAIKIDPKFPGAQNSLGYLLARSGDQEGAVEHYRLAVEAAPRWPNAWVDLAAALAVESHFAEAKQAVARALQLDPGNAQAKELSDQLAHDPAAQTTAP